MAQKQQRYWNKTLKYYWQNIREFRHLIIAMFVLATIAIILGDVLSQLFLGRLIDSLFEYENGTTTKAAVMSLLFLTLATKAGKAIIWRILGFIDTYILANFVTNNQSMVLQKMLLKSYNFFTNNFGGSLVNKFNQFKWSGLELALGGFYDYYATALRFILFTVVLFFLFPRIAILLVIWSVIYIFLVAYLVKKKVPLTRRSTIMRSKSTGVFADIITNILTVKSFAASSAEMDRFDSIIKEEEQTNLKSWYFDHSIRVFQEFMLLVLVVVVLVISVQGVLAGTITAGTVVVVQLYINRISTDMFELSHYLRQTEKQMNNAFEMVEIFEQPLLVKDSQNPQRPAIKNGQISFKDMSFVYSDGEENVFDHFNLEISAGQKIGLVGHSGSGKSTITKLLMRYEDISGGAILIDGQNIAELAQEDLRAHLAVVPQEPILFHRSITENIRYGDPAASDEEVIRVAKQANAHEFIKDLPKGYETLVGERGIKLSGGEKQRVAIARAMLSKAPVLLLDEATSALDSKSENLIQSALDRLMKNRTTIVIAHRLSTIRMMDRIVVLEKGTIIEDGSHDELLEQNGHYAQLWAHQAGGFLQENI